MRTTLLAVALVAGLGSLAGCPQDDPTDITGAYFGNATATLAPAAAGSGGEVAAGSATIELATAGVDGVTATLGSGCALDATLQETLQIDEYRQGKRFVFQSDAVLAQQPCALPIGGGVAIAVVTGDLVGENGGTLQLEIGGTITAARDAALVGGYAVYQFAGVR